MRLTKTAVDRLTSPIPTPPATKAQAFHRDDTLKGFAVRITSSGAKSFIVETRVNGKVRRSTLGKYPALTVEQARRQAQQLLGKIASGADPLAEKREAEARAVTLAEAFRDYLDTRKSLKPKTVKDYQGVMRIAFSGWQQKPLTAISKDMIKRHYKNLGNEHGKAYANLAMRVLRAVFNFAAGKYEDAQGRSILPENPVKRLSATRGWYRVERRQTVIKAHDLKPWYQAVMALESTHSAHKPEVVRDYLLLTLFTELRRQEAASLRWDHVELVDKTLTVTDTKNHEDHTLPLSDFLFDLLTRRKAEANGSPFVFPGKGEGGYLVEPRKQMVKVTAASGVAFTIHDLRRTFITVAESLDIPAYALKRLLNHKMNNDVTAGYIVADVERLRVPMQKITDYLLMTMDVKPTAEVVDIRKAV